MRVCPADLRFRNHACHPNHGTTEHDCRIDEHVGAHHRANHVASHDHTAPPPPTTTIEILTLLPQQDCDPNYSGTCVPIASDVDCAGGSGNGPAYVAGQVYVVGSDIYGLDGNDNDGIGCES